VVDRARRVPVRGRTGKEVRVAPTRVPRIPPPERKLAPVGVIIPVRDRLAPMARTLKGIFNQTLPPSWVTISDLGSSTEVAEALQGLAETFGFQYLRIEYFGIWNKGLCFNTALKNSPEATYVMQVDADVVLQPHALEALMRALQDADAAVSVPLQEGKRMSEWSVGGCVVFPRDWLFETRGIDEAYEGWGNQDIDLWDRAQKALHVIRIEEELSWHQPHEPQESRSDEANVEKNLVRRVSQWEGAGLPVNPEGFGEGRI
jgi:hypothetical protein